jgi:hypothetical protein
MIDYDLNIYRHDTDTEQWYIDAYSCNDLGRTQVGTQLALTLAESADLDFGNGYFAIDNDFWYGLDLFLEDYEYQISDRLWLYFNGLPR